MGKKKYTLTPLSSGVNQAENHKVKLESPTYIRMMNSFLIKNPDPSFERCYQVIKRREL